MEITIFDSLIDTPDAFLVGDRVAAVKYGSLSADIKSLFKEDMQYV